MLGAILLYKYSCSILQDVHWWQYIQDPLMAGILEFRIQSDHLLHIQYGISCCIQTDIDDPECLVLRPGDGQHISTTQ